MRRGNRNILWFKRIVTSKAKDIDDRDEDYLIKRLPDSILPFADLQTCDSLPARRPLPISANCT